MHKVVDVTINYPDGVPTFWAFMQGKCGRVTMTIEGHDVPASVRAAADDDARRAAVTEWVETLWRAKDAALAGSQAAPDPITGTNDTDAETPHAGAPGSAVEDPAR